MIERINAYFKDLEEIITKPGATLGKVMDEKRWIAHLAFILIIIFILSFISPPYTLDRMPELMQNSQVNKPFENINYYSLNFFQKIMFVFPVLLAVFIILGAGAFFTYLFFGSSGVDGIYINYFSIVTAASMIDIVFPKIIETFSSIFHVKIIPYFSPAFLLGMIEQKTFFSILVSRFNYFTIWYTIAVGLGIAYFGKITIKKSMTISTIYLLFKSLVFSALKFFFKS